MLYVFQELLLKLFNKLKPLCAIYAAKEQLQNLPTAKFWQQKKREKM